MTKEKDSLSDKLTEIVGKTKECRAKREAIERSFKKIQEIGINDNNRYLEAIETKRINLYYYVSFSDILIILFTLYIYSFQHFQTIGGTSLRA